MVGRYRRWIDGLDSEIGRLYSEDLSVAEISACLSTLAGVELAGRFVLTVVSARDRYETECSVFALRIAPDHGSFHRARDLPLLPEVSLGGVPLLLFRFPGGHPEALYTSGSVESFHACFRRKLRSRLGVHSLANGSCLVVREAERQTSQGTTGRIGVYDDLNDEETSALGTGDERAK